MRLDSEAELHEAVARHLTDQLGIRHPRYGTLHGLRTTRDDDCWFHDRPTTSRVLPIRINAEASDALQEQSTTHARWRREELKARHQDISPEGLTLVALGYLEGQLPDGLISLH
ncbi:hypothetical protein AB0C77_00405 [Streptomyces sp. NPDC048629]|uniref:hypothetical protein n=1 Tax=Streptomyces sp. NPDC048629 TaxID=3154824 RepID=UPI003418C5BF